MENCYKRKIKTSLTCSAVLYQTINETDWMEVDTEYSGTYMEFNDIEFYNTTIGWILGDHIILHTSDGGKNWEGHLQYVSHGTSRIEIFNETTIWTTGFGSLFFTSDKGKTWTEKPMQEHFRSHFNFVDFLNETHGWAAGSSLFSTSNGGKTWKNDSSWTFDDTPRQLEFVNSEIGYILGFLGIYRTNDTGSTWYQISDISFHRMSLIDVNTGWVVYLWEKVYKMEDGKTWKAVPSPPGPSSNSYPTFFDVAFVNATHGWICGKNPSMIATRDGGKTWYSQEVPELAQQALRALYFVNTTHGWAVGKQGAIIYTTTGGGVGTKMVPPENRLLVILITFTVFLGIVVGYLFIKNNKRYRNR
jgi:photosystem II stability/assembly factor-like uncharacterized protein